METFEDDESEVGVSTLKVAKCVFDVVLRFLKCVKSLPSAPLFCVTFSFLCMHATKASFTGTFFACRKNVRISEALLSKRGRKVMAYFSILFYFRYVFKMTN